MKEKTLEQLRKKLLVLLLISVAAFGLAADEDRFFTIELETRGKGEITLSPEGGLYKEGTEVTITAKGVKGFVFAKWDEDLEGYESSKTVVIKEDLEVKAIFKRGYKKGVVQNTNYGRVKGERETHKDSFNSNIDFDVLSWRGIPYAAPPVGELRWKAPREPESWRGVREVRSNSRPAIQFNMHNNKPMGVEDCLYLNIFRPNTAEEGLPVYFWIHGGANISGHVGEYEHIRNFADKNNAIVVVIQYRVGDMGIFFNEAQEGTELDRSGNYATLDQIKALKWVRDNIEYFGGNPQNVTIAGESAGAHNVLALLVSPLAKGLFHRAVYQSSGLLYVEKAEALARSNNLILALQQKRAAEGIGAGKGDEGYELIYEADAMELLLTRDPAGYYGLIIDGLVIPEDPMKMLAEGNYNRVPVILGGCRDEISIFSTIFMVHSNPIFNQIYGTNIPDYSGLAAMLSKGIDVTKGYSGPDGELKAVSPQDIESFIKANKILSKMWLSKHVHRVADLLRKHQDDVYLYQFSWDSEESSQYQRIVGATHANEIPFFQGSNTIDMWLFGNVYTESTKAGREELERVMTAYMGNFIYAGDPNAEALPDWEPLAGPEQPLKLIILDSRDGSSGAEPAYEMVEKVVDHNRLIQEGMALEGNDPVAYDIFRAYMPGFRLQ